MSLTKLGVLKWEEDIDKNLESLDRKGSELGNEVVLKKAWEQDDLDEGEEDLQRRNQWAFLN
jgi:hypothetical protein